MTDSILTEGEAHQITLENLGKNADKVFKACDDLTLTSTIIQALNSDIAKSKIKFEELACYRSLLEVLELKDNPAKGVFLEGQPNMNGTVLLTLLCGALDKDSDFSDDLSQRILDMFKIRDCQKFYEMYCSLLPEVVEVAMKGKELMDSLLEKISQPNYTMEILKVRHEIDAIFDILKKKTHFFSSVTDTEKKISCIIEINRLYQDLIGLYRQILTYELAANIDNKQTQSVIDSLESEVNSLTENMTLLQRHIATVKEIQDSISECIQQLSR